MNGALKLFLLSAAVFVAAWAIDHFAVPPTVPTSWGHDPQPLWQVEIAFLLRALENVSGAVATVIFLIAAAFYVRRWLKPNAQL